MTENTHFRPCGMIWERIKDAWSGENDHNIVRKGGRRPPNPPPDPPSSEFPPDPPRLSGI